MTSPSQAAKAAKMLIGNFPNAKPHDVDGYITAIAATLGQYPIELARECADPRTGIARTFKYQAPNIADVVEWCDEQLRIHQVWARSKPRAPELPPPPANPAMAEKVISFLRSLADRLRIAPDPFAPGNDMRREFLTTKRKETLTQKLTEPATNSATGVQR